MTKKNYLQIAIIITICKFMISCDTVDQVVQPTTTPSVTYTTIDTETPPTQTLKPTTTTIPSITPEPTEEIPPTPTITHTPISGPTERLNIQALCMVYSYVTMQECPIQSDQFEKIDFEQLTFPDPVVLEGAGNNSKLNFYNPFDIALVHIRGNEAGELFWVRGVTPDSHRANLPLVNTADRYEGSHPIDLYARQHTLRFEIAAIGDWKIELRPLSDARMIDVPGDITGFGDEAILVIGDTPGSITFRGNSSGQIFNVFAYGSTETMLVNTKYPFEGSQNLPPDTVLLKIQSDGEWEISISGK